MRNSWYKKGLVVGIIVMFFSLTYIPKISAEIDLIRLIPSENSNDNFENDNLVEITVSFIDNNEKMSQTSWLTTEKANEFDNLIFNFKKTLANIEKVEETIVIYNQLIESLNELDMLPYRLNVNAEQLLTNIGYDLEKKDSTNYKLNINPNQKNHFSYNQNIKLNNNGEEFLNNSMCFISGQTTNTTPIPYDAQVSNRISALIYNFLTNLAPKFPVWEDYILGLRLVFLGLLHGYYAERVFIADGKPYQIASDLSVGLLEGEDWLYPAIGWVHTTGLNGVKDLEGEMYGHLYWTPFIYFILFPGVDGYTGIWTYNNETKDNFYSGYARAVSIGTEPPSLPFLDL